MNTKNVKDLELEIWKEIARNQLSTSHDHWHIDRVLDFSTQLWEIYGGDPEVITVAGIIHDLGRSDPNLRGTESVENSEEQARKILKRINYPTEKANQVLTAVREHDKPDFSPTTIEGRILKEADFLAGFGSWGVLRIAMWAAETGGGVEQILDRIDNRMQARFESLEFRESRSWASKEVIFAKLFLSSLKKTVELPKIAYKGRYIILEGNSGSGKDTQVNLIRNRLEKEKKTVTIVSEPANVYKSIRNLLQKEYEEPLEDHIIRRFVLIADRYIQIKRIVEPALERGDIVISNRSYISTMVYQCNDDLDTIQVAYMHNFVPEPTLLILLDIDADTALTRVDKRGAGSSRYENYNDLIKHQQRYLDICQSNLCNFPVRIIDASHSINEVFDRLWDALSDVFTDVGFGKTSAGSR